jgi:uncharacterized protein (TIGR02453 family)
MIHKSTFDFIKALTKNNNKPWFDANRDKYETARENIKENVIQIIPKLSAIDADIAKAVIEPKHCLFRINRDVRFSKEKHPYKTNMAMQFNSFGKSMQRAGYYVHIQPGSCFLGGGIWGPMAPELKKMRQEIDYNFADFKKIITSKKFVSSFGTSVQNQEALVRPPKGYEADNPAIEILKLKHFIATKHFTDSEMMDKNFVKNIMVHFANLEPFIRFINEGLA